MSLEKQVMEELKAAMLAKDEKGLRSLRAIKAAILLAKTAEKSGKELSHEEEIKLLQKLVKQRKDSLAIYEQQHREDLASREREEIEIIGKYLPEQLSPEDLKKELSAIITETGASSRADMGKVMGIAAKKLAGRADGKMISATVMELMGNN